MTGTAPHPRIRAATDGHDLSVLIVDDAEFSSTLVARQLDAAGFRDVRLTQRAEDALEALRHRRADVLVCDWMMPGMDGLALTRRVRQLDQADSQYTYVLLLTGREEPNALADAFAAGVDDFVEKSLVRSALVPRVNAGIRIMLQQRHLRERLDDLDARLHVLETTRGVDALTGLGDRDTALDALSRTLRQTMSRGGAVCALALGIQEPEAFEQEHGEETVAEVIQSIGLRLTQLVRPLDVVTRPAQDMFLVIMHHAELAQCTAPAFRRITDAIDMRSFETSDGFVTVPAAMAVCGADAERTGLPEPLPFYDHVRAALAQARDLGTTQVRHWQPSEARQPEHP